MKCPFCKDLDNRVIDSRLTRDGGAIRRRRQCARCRRRFTTYERVEEILPMVVKKDGRREVFDRMKIIGGLKRACEKRPIGMAAIEHATDRVERSLQERAEKEISSAVVGEMVMRALHRLDKVAYVRLASVYRSFKAVGEFMSALEELIQERRGETVRRAGKRRRSGADS